MKQKSEPPGVVRDACPQHPAGQPGSTTRPKRRSALCSMACAAGRSIAELCRRETCAGSPGSPKAPMLKT